MFSHPINRYLVSNIVFRESFDRSIAVVYTAAASTTINQPTNKTLYTIKAKYLADYRLLSCFKVFLYLELFFLNRLLELSYLTLAKNSSWKATPKQTVLDSILVYKRLLDHYTWPLSTCVKNTDLCEGNLYQRGNPLYMGYVLFVGLHITAKTYA